MNSNNSSENGILEEPNLLSSISLGVVLSFILVAIIVGNVSVILAVVLYPNMRTLSNALIVSLASADLLVALLVLPFSLQNELTDKWTLGNVLCDVWVTADVFCCTASILNIVVIAIDRYWLITRNVRYTHSHGLANRRRVCVIMLCCVWLLSVIVSCSPLFGWRSDDRPDGVCDLSQDPVYTVFSTFSAFWIPLTVILIVYARIYKFASRRARLRARVRPPPPSAVVSPPQNNGALLGVNDSPQHSQDGPSCSPTVPAMDERRRAAYQRRTRNSARTLGLIIGGFVLCWLPFFINATIMPLCGINCSSVPRWVDSAVLWLGYLNSILNPLIYAIWDRNFRKAFRQLWSRCLPTRLPRRVRRPSHRNGGEANARMLTSPL